MITEKIQTHCQIHRQTDENPKPRRVIDVNNCKAIQQLYRRNRRLATRLILRGESGRCRIPTKRLEQHFQDVFSEKYFHDDQLNSIPDPPLSRSAATDQPFSEEDIL